MAGKKQFQIQTPRGTIYTTGSNSGAVTARLEWNPGFGREESAKFEKRQQFVDQECIRWMAPLTPRRTGVLIQSATLGTVIGSGEICQIAPYARRQYYEHKSNSYWFERMKNLHKDSILKGARNIG